MLHYLTDWWEFIKIHQYYTRAITSGVYYCCNIQQVSRDEPEEREDEKDEKPEQTETPATETVPPMQAESQTDTTQGDTQGDTQVDSSQDIETADTQPVGKLHHSHVL